MCKAYGFGCRRDVAPIKGLLDEEVTPVAAPREDGLMTVEQAEKTLLSHLEVLLAEALVESRERGGSLNCEESLLAEIEELTDIFTSIELERFHFNMLWSSCRHGYTLTASYLSSYFDPNERDLDYGSTPLHLLFEIPESDVMKVAESLVESGADLNLVSDGKMSFVDEESHLTLDGTPLDWCIKTGSHMAVQCLLALGADPLISGSSMTPLCRAVTLYRADIIRLIMDTIGPIEKLMEAEMRLSKLTFEIVYGFGPQLAAEHERAILHGNKIADAANRAFDTVLEYIREDTSHFIDLLLYQTLTPEVQYTTAVLVPYLTELFIEKGAHVVPRFSARGRPLLHRFADIWKRDGENCELLLETLL